MGSKGSKDERADDSTKIETKEEYDKNVENFNQFVRSHSKKDLNIQQDQTSMAYTVEATDHKRNGEEDDSQEEYDFVKQNEKKLNDLKVKLNEQVNTEKLNENKNDNELEQQHEQNEQQEQIKKEEGGFKRDEADLDQQELEMLEQQQQQQQIQQQQEEELNKLNENNKLQDKLQQEQEQKLQQEQEYKLQQEQEYKLRQEQYEKEKQQFELQQEQYDFKQLQSQEKDKFQCQTEVSNCNNFIGVQGGAISRIYEGINTEEFIIPDWIQMIVQDMSAASFDGSEYEIHHTESSIKIILQFTAMNYKKIDKFVELDHTLWMEYVMVEIQYHHFDKVGIARICNKIQKLFHLQYLVLDFSNNKIAMNNECITNCVSNLPDLKIFTLNLQGNNIGEEGFRQFSKSLSNLKFLNQLNLNFKWNKMLDRGISYVSASLARMKFINQFSIDVSGNQITQYGAQALFDSISGIGKLSQLNVNISNNKIEYQGSLSLSECLKQQENLRELTLYLDGNNITTAGGEAIVDSLTQLFNLNKLELDLSFNNIPIFEAKQIREKIHTRCSIQKKDLRFF